MKFIIVSIIFGLAIAEPQNYRYNQRQEGYAASGYRPSGAQFRLPERQEEPRVYGPPEETTTEIATEEPTTLEPDSSNFSETKVKGNLEQPNEEEVEQIDTKDEPQRPQEQGVYYILLPTGQLQKVQYLTMNDQEKMAYTAQLQYQNVEPIQGPIYAYNPNSPFLQYVL